MFGGGLQQVWPFAAVALHYVEGFEERYRKAVEAAEKFKRLLAADGRFGVEALPNGSHMFALRLKAGDAQAFARRLAAAEIGVRAPGGNRFLLAVNETLNRRTPGELAQAFRTAAG
jgi:threonine aldolase